MPLDANGNVVITHVPLMEMPTGFKGIGVNYGDKDVATSGVTVNGKPVFHNYDSPSHGSTYLHGNWGPVEQQIPHPNDDYQSNNNSSAPSYAQTNSPAFIKDTYDPPLGYERYDSPGDNPYISSYTPVQHSYMNDPSTLSAEELDYRNQNIHGLDDRQDSIENAGALMNDYIFNIKEELRETPATSIETIRQRDDDDDDGPYSEYDPEKYY